MDPFAIHNAAMAQHNAAMAQHNALIQQQHGGLGGGYNHQQALQLQQQQQLQLQQQQQHQQLLSSSSGAPHTSSSYSSSSMSNNNGVVQQHVQQSVTQNGATQSVEYMADSTKGEKVVARKFIAGGEHDPQAIEVIKTNTVDGTQPQVVRNFYNVDPTNTAAFNQQFSAVAGAPSASAVASTTSLSTNANPQLE